MDGPRGDKAPLFGAGRFEVRGTLGTGGAGIVYRVFDKQLGREVALKHLKSASGRDLFRFKREFRSLADITHPNLVALHELHAADGNWYFTMELVEGVSWIDWVRPSQRGTIGPQRSRQDILGAVLSETRLRGALIQLVDALIALHRAGKLHRDLKPSNVIVTSLGRLALLDFGLVAGITEGDPERLAVGTPAYMSPEQASDQPLGEASDWYAVGCMLYEALTGRRPFEGDAEQIMTRKQREAPAHPTTFAPRAAQDLARLCMSLLVPVASARPTGMQILTQLGAAPSSTTRRLAKSIPPVAFVGRRSEMDELRRALADSRRRGVTVVVKGRSGIGKSTLVRRFVRELGDAVIALEGRCFEREAVPFKMLDGVVDALTGVIVAMPAPEVDALAPKELGSLVRLFPVMRRVPQFADALETSAVPADPQELRRRGFTALRGILVRLARQKPVVIFVDDAHWGDADSCTFLAELIHGGDPGLLVVVAQRPEDYLGVIAQLRRPAQGSARRGEIRDLEIAPLPEDDARSLAAQLSEDPARAAAVVVAAGGHPLAITEMARVANLPANTKMDDLVRSRALMLTPEAQAMLAVSAIAARPLPVAIAAQAAGVPVGHDEAALLSIERLATLRHVDGDAILTPAHDFVRSAVVAGLGTEAKASYHEAIARAFEAAQQTATGASARLDSQAIVEHWLAAGHPANAAHHAVAAAQAAEEALAFKRAAELYQIALTFGLWDIEGQRDLMARKAHALACAGQLDEAVTEYGLAAQMVPDTEAIDLERLRVEALLRRGRMSEALPAAEKLLAQVGQRIPLGAKASRAKLAAQWMSAKLRGLEFAERSIAESEPQVLLAADVLYSIASGLAFTDPALGRVVQSELIRSALDAGEPIRVALALAQEVVYSSAGGRSSGAVETVAKKLEAIAQKIAAPQIVGLADAAIGIGAYANGRWNEARERLESGLGVMRDHGAGVRWEIDIGDTYWLGALFYLGEWREMARQAQLLLREALERRDVIAQSWLRTGRCTSAWIIAGRVDEARQHVETATAMLGDGFQLPHLHAITAAAELDLFAGDAASAAHRLRDAWAQIERLGVLRMQVPRCELALLRARIALVSGDPRGAREHATALSKEDAPWAIALGHLVTAACCAAEGEPHDALDAIRLAEPLLDDAGMLGFLHVARGYRGRLEGGAAGMALEVAARDALVELGARDPEILANYLVPWSG